MAKREILVESSTDTAEEIKSATSQYVSQSEAETARQKRTEDTEAKQASEEEQRADDPTEEPEGDEGGPEQIAEGGQSGDDEKPKPRKPSPYERRRQKRQEEIDRLTAQRYTLEGQVAELERRRQALDAPPPQQQVEPQQPAEPAREPQIADYDSFEDYHKAHLAWQKEHTAGEIERQVSERLSQQRQVDMEAAQRAASERAFAAAQQNLRASIDASRQRHEDFDDVTQAASDFPTSSVMQQIIMQHPDGGEIMYALAQRPDVCHKLATMPPGQAVYEIGRLHASVIQPLLGAEQASTQAPARPVAQSGRGPAPKSFPVTRASEPIEPLAPGAAAGSRSLADIAAAGDYAAYKRARNANR